MPTAPKEHERRHSLVVAGLRESDRPSAIERNAMDVAEETTILDTLGVEAEPSAVYRMGQKQRSCDAHKATSNRSTTE